MSPLAGLRHFLQESTQVSSSRPSNNQSYPGFPSNSTTGDHEMRDVPLSESDGAEYTSSTAPGITPYLGLRARLSQIWINRWTVLLALVLVRLLLAVQNLDEDLVSAKQEALSACTGVESMGSAMASMPHYMSAGVNELAASGVEKAVNGLMSMLLMTITGVEELVLFVINMMTSTYVCLITLAISGSLHVALDLIEDATTFLNKTLGDIESSIEKDVTGFQTDLNTFMGKVSGSISSLFGGSSKPPTLSIPDLDRLNGVQLPSSLTDQLNALNKSIPDFNQVQNFTNTAIRLPFEEVKSLINNSLTTYHFDRSVFPVPQKEQLSFCSNNNDINNFFTELRDIADKVRKAFIAVIIIAAILVCIPMGYREMWRWRTMQSRAQLLRQHAFDPVDVVQIASRPLSSTVGIKAASRFSSSRKQILTRWWVSYATSTPALFVLALGIAGLFACACHMVLLKSVEKEVPALAAEVGHFADEVVDILNNASQQWAVGTNRVIDSANSDINKEVFGWVNTTTGAINDTLNTFVSEMSDALNTTFGGTPLYDPIKEVLNCLIGLKIAAVQKGLTWVSDNAQVNFPHLPNDTFSLGAIASIANDSKTPGDSFLADPDSQATDQITNAVAAVTSRIQNHIRTEAIISTCVVLAWVVIVLIGLARTAFLFLGRDKTRGEGGPTYTGQFRSPPRSPRSVQEPIGVAKSFSDPFESDSFAPTPMTSSGRSSRPPAYGGEQEKRGWAGQRNDAVVQHSRNSSRASNRGLVSGEKKSFNPLH